MTGNTKPEALRIADEFKLCIEYDSNPSIIDIEKAEAEIRRLHAENERLSCLCDKWNSECDEFREDNKRLAAALVEAQQAGWTNADADAARLALELECLLMDTKDTAVVSKWWQSANEALELHRARLQEVQPSPPAQAASSAVLKAIREANMQLVRTGDDAFMLVPYKVATAQAAESVRRDAERLDWLLWKLPGDALRHVVGEIADTSDGQEFRAAIDAARAAQEGK